MKVITGVGGWPAEIPEQARAAEAAGFDCITCGELAHDSLLIMTMAATATERIGLQTSVTIAFPRSPMVLAMEAWDLQHLSGGRFILGLGQPGEGPQRAPLRRHVVAAGAAHARVHPHDARGLGLLAGRRAGGVPPASSTRTR